MKPVPPLADITDLLPEKVENTTPNAIHRADTFKEFPAIQKPNTFTIDDAIAKMPEAGGCGSH